MVVAQEGMEPYHWSLQLCSSTSELPRPQKSRVPLPISERYPGPVLSKGGVFRHPLTSVSSVHFFITYSRASENTPRDSKARVTSSL